MNRIKLILIALIGGLSLLSLQAQRQPSMEERKLMNAIGAINALYVDSVNENKIVNAAITAMMKALDPHSVFIPKDEVDRANEPLQGSFEGIGIRFQIFEDTLLVVQTISGCPAEKVGVLPGDRMIFIEDEIIAGVKMQNSDIMKKLRGPKGTEVAVKIKRTGVNELLLFRIIRDKIPINSVDASYMIANDIGYIKINNFGNNTVPEYQDAFAELKKQGMKSLILNLQGNGGGYLNAAIHLADEFLARNELVVYTQGLHQSKSIANASAIGGFEEGKLVVLVDEFSASAAEIVTGAVQDWDRGVVVGRRTFGKGLVQKPIPLVDGSMLRLTTARYYTPSGRCIQKAYEKGNDEAYAKDLSQRMKHGELMHADSIHFPDSLKYKTLHSGRNVYGGGGIMPDIFVPLDTTKYTSWHRKMVAQGIMNKFSVRYIEQNRETILKNFKDFDKFNMGFCINEAQLQEFRKLGEEAKIVATDEVYNESKLIISLQIKALVARDIYGNSTYYRIMDSSNDALQRAIEVIKTPGLYEKILK